MNKFSCQSDHAMVPEKLGHLLTADDSSLGVPPGQPPPSLPQLMRWVCSLLFIPASQLRHQVYLTNICKCFPPSSLCGICICPPAYPGRGRHSLLTLTPPAFACLGGRSHCLGINFLFADCPHSTMNSLVLKRCLLK